MGERLTDDRAASPVIGIVLVVAIVVVLAAVVGTFVTSLGDDVSEAAQGGVSVTVSEATDDGFVEVTFVDRGNTERLEVLYSVEPDGNDVSTPDGTTLQEPGSTIRLEEDASNPEETITVSVTVVAFESSGEKGVILETDGEI
jgi:flagellin-like protein